MPNPTPFTVKIIRRGIPTEQLLADVADVARRLGTRCLSLNQYQQQGRFSSTHIARRVGSWTAALALVNLQPAHRFRVDPQLALEDVKRVARQLHASTLKYTDYARHGRFTPEAVKRHFGPSWHKVLIAAGLQPRHYRMLTDAELLDNLKTVWTALGRQPLNRDMRPPLSRFTTGPYYTRYKTWNNALRAFDKAMHPDRTSPPPPVDARPRRIVSAHINWRLRYKILQRDHFRCQACGRSPATHPGITLQIDHIHPRSQSGPSTQANLQTLCNQCNSGKGDTT